MPYGTRVKLRLVHNFHITDGLISREIGYEMWLADDDDAADTNPQAAQTAG
jgi:hypothetical protein